MNAYNIRVTVKNRTNTGFIMRIHRHLAENFHRHFGYVLIANENDTIFRRHPHYRSTNWFDLRWQLGSYRNFLIAIFFLSHFQKLRI